MRKETRVVETGNRVKVQHGLVAPMVWGVGQDVTAGSKVREGQTAVVRVRRCRETKRGRSASSCAQSESLPAAGAARAAEPDLAMYRKYTEALLRRYQRMKLQAGRVPSRMDQEIFRGRMSHYKVEGFDDAVIFCTDVERCLRKLNASDERLVRRIAVQEYSMGEAAAVLGMSLRSCIVLYWRALDRVTKLFLEARLLNFLSSLNSEKPCQEAARHGDELNG